MTRPAVGVKAHVIAEQGRWVLYLDVSFWREGGFSEDENPLETVRQRIRDYSTQREAEVAAHWIERTADRGKPHQNLGF